MDPKQEALFEELKSVVKIPVGENPLLHIRQAISLALRTNVLWRWAKDGPYYEFRWSPQNPPIRVPESQANVYLVKRVIQELTPVDKPESKDETEPLTNASGGHFSKAAASLLTDNGYLELASQVQGTGAKGNITVKDVKKFLDDPTTIDLPE